MIIVTAIALMIFGSATAIAMTSDSKDVAVNQVAITNNIEDNSEDSNLALIEKLNQNTYFTSKLSFKEMEHTVNIDKETALQKAKEFVGEANNKEAKSISAVLSKYTNNEFSKLPDSDILLKDYPVWVVTFKGVTAKKHSVKGGKGSNTILADSYVFVDANTGAVLQRISHTSSLTTK